MSGRVRDRTVPDGTSNPAVLRIRVGDPWKHRMRGAGIRSSLDDGGTLQSPKPKPLDPWSRALTARDRPLAAPASLVHVHRGIVDRLDLPGGVTGRSAGLMVAVEPATQRPTGRYSLFRCGFAPRRPADIRYPRRCRRCRARRGLQRGAGPVDDLPMAARTTHRPCAAGQECDSSPTCASPPTGPADPPPSLLNSETSHSRACAVCEIGERLQSSTEPGLWPSGMFGGIPPC